MKIVSTSLALCLFACGSDAGLGASSASDAGVSSPSNDAGNPTIADSGSHPDVRVVDCSALPAAGEWDNVSPPEFLNPSNMQAWSVAINPLDKSVFASAGNVTNGCGGNGQPACAATGVFKSSDCGATWKLVSTGRSSSNLKTGDPWALRIDPVNPQNIYINNGYGNGPTLYKSTNGGVDFDPLTPDADDVLTEHQNFVQAVALDPADPSHLLVSFHDNCSGKYTPNCLSESKDGGATWREFDGPAELTGWAEAATVSILGATDFLYTTPAGWGGFFSADSGATWTKVLTGPAYGFYGGGAHIGPDGTAYVGVSNTGIFFSKGSANSPLGALWTLIPGSPQGALATDDGVNLIVSGFNDSSGQPFWSAPLDGLTTATMPKWTNLNAKFKSGGSMYAYDSVHHITYVASPGDGLLRVISP